MFKKNVLLLSICSAILTAMVPAYAYGSEKISTEYHADKTVLESILDNDIKDKTLSESESESTPIDLIISEKDAIIENKTIRNLRITKDAGSSTITLKNVEIKRELLIEGDGKNSIIIENSKVNKLSTNNETGQVEISLKGNSTVETAYLKSNALLEQEQLTNSGFKKLTLDLNSSIKLKVNKNLALSSDNKNAAEISADSTLTAKNPGTSIISAVINSKKTQICEITVKNPFVRTIKILSIGNSFSQDALYYLHDIANSAGINIIAGNLYIGGCSLEKHSNNALSNAKNYVYYKWTYTGVTEKNNISMEEAIHDENWDYITFQQSSGDSGIYTTYQPYLNNLIKYVKSTSLNPNVKLALNMTWAYSSKSTNDNFDQYNHDQSFMYNAISKAYRQASYSTGIDVLIPCGTSIQNARTNKYLRAVGNELTTDGYHLNEGVGRYIAGLTLFETIIKEENINKDLYKDINFIPNTIDTTENLIYSAKKAVENAIANPFEIKADIPKAYEY